MGERKGCVYFQISLPPKVLQILDNLQKRMGYRYRGSLIRYIIIDWLISKGYLKDEDLDLSKPDSNV